MTKPYEMFAPIDSDNLADVIKAEMFSGARSAVILHDLTAESKLYQKEKGG